MRRSYELTRTADEDLGEILHYIAEHDGLDRALHIHAMFVDEFEAPAAMPGIGSKRPRLTGGRFRWHRVSRWIVIYDPEPSDILILRVLDGARDIDRLLARVFDESNRRASDEDAPLLPGD